MASSDTLKATGRFIAWTVGIVVVAVAVLRIFFVDTVTIGHDGMAPTLVTGDRVAVWRTQDVDMGDVVVCNQGDVGFVLGRIVAKEDMVVDTYRGQLQVAGTRPDVDFRGTKQIMNLERGVLEEMRYGIEALGNTEHEIVLPERHAFAIRPTRVGSGVWLLGDNRGPHQQDSRTFGDVDPATCIGKVFMILWPAGDRGDDVDHMPLGLVD